MISRSSSRREGGQPPQRGARFGGVASPALSRIDRLHASLPPLALLQLQTQAPAVWPASSSYGLTLSDHVPVCFSIAPRDQHPLPKWLVVHAELISIVSEMQVQANLTSLEPFARLKKHKAIIRAASSVALKRILNEGVSSKDQELQILATTGRAIWFDLIHLIPVAHKSFPALRGVVEVVQDHVARQKSFKIQGTLWSRRA